MIVTVFLGVYLAAYALLIPYIWLGRSRIKRLLKADREDEALLQSLYDAAHGETPAEGSDEAEALISRLKDAYNKRVERHDEIDVIRRSARQATVTAVVLGVLMTVVALFGV